MMVFKHFIEALCKLKRIISHLSNNSVTLCLRFSTWRQTKRSSEVWWNWRRGPLSSDKFSSSAAWLLTVALVFPSNMSGEMETGFLFPFLMRDPRRSLAESKGNRQQLECVSVWVCERAALRPETPSGGPRCSPCGWWREPLQSG